MDKFFRSNTSAPPIAILGVPFDNVNITEAVEIIEQMIASRRPHYVATANVDFLVQALHDVELRRILMDAHLVLCDGTPVVWASRLLGNALQERVAGADLVPLLIQLAARKSYRVFFLGGSPEVNAQAISRLEQQFPTLLVAGHYSPPFKPLLEMDNDEIARRIAAAKPDLLFVSLGCPKQEKWIAMHYRSLGVPVSIGVGGTIDFLAGRTVRAPRWIQKSGTEWLFRLAQEPRRLFGRYARDLCWFSRVILQQWWRMQPLKRRKDSAPKLAPQTASETCKRIRFPRSLDIHTVGANALICEEALASSRHCLLELSDVAFIDSSGMGLLTRLQKMARVAGRQLILIAPSAAVRSAMTLMRLEDFFTVVRDVPCAYKLIDEQQTSSAVIFQRGYFPWKPSLFWQGEITAANAEQVWAATVRHIEREAKSHDAIAIDLSALNFIDSTGLGIMLRAKKRAAANGVKLNFVSVQPNVRNVLRLAKLESSLLEDAA